MHSGCFTVTADPGGVVPSRTNIAKRFYACPRIVADMKNIEQVPADKKDKVVFVLVSFDSETDDPARLAEFA